MARWSVLIDMWHLAKWSNLCSKLLSIKMS
jgi:hypothetical protein